MKTIADFSDISITPFIIDCNVQRCCVLPVSLQQNVVALVICILPYKAKRQESSLIDRIEQLQYHQFLNKFGFKTKFVNVVNGRMEEFNPEPEYEKAVKDTNLLLK